MDSSAFQMLAAGLAQQQQQPTFDAANAAPKEAPAPEAEWTEPFSGKGKKEPPRLYSLGSAPYEPEIAITIKEERYISGETPYPPLLSPLLTYHIPVGTKMVISGFRGAYTLTPDIVDRVDRVVHVCAGSGIVPNLGLVKESLHRGDPLEHVLLFSNKTREDIIYYQDFEELHQQYPDKFDVVHCITREDPAGVRNARRGRISAELLREFMPDISRSFVFTCGPGISPHERRAARERNEKPEPKFVENMMATMLEIGLGKEQIKQESWG